MNPLQSFVFDECEHAPGTRTRLTDFWDQYRQSLDGTEASKWRDPTYVFAVLSRRFPIIKGAFNVRYVAELSIREVDWDICKALEVAEVA